MAAEDLKKELREFLRVIMDKDYTADDIDKAREALLALRKLTITTKTIKKTLPLKLGGSEEFLCAEQFLCPISKNVMIHPVVVATGETYDRNSIKIRLKAGNRVCPQTKKVLSHTFLSSNNLIREMISEWCDENGIDLSEDDADVHDEYDKPTDKERDHFHALIQKMSSSSSSSSTMEDEQKAAAKELRLLTKKSTPFRALFGEFPDSISQLLLEMKNLLDDVDFHEDIITTLLHLSIYESNKAIVVKIPDSIPFLVNALSAAETSIKIKSNAAAALFTLSTVDSNKKLIADFGAIKPLIDLLEEGHPSAMTDAVAAILSLCDINENKTTAVLNGAVMVVLKKIKDRSFVQEMVAILELLSSHPKAVDEMRDEEDRHQTLSELAQDSDITAEAKRKARTILRKIHGVIIAIHP